MKEAILDFPQKLMELSVRSLEAPIHHRLDVIGESSSIHETKRYPHCGPPSTRLFKLRPDLAKIPIIAVDVSSIKLGETCNGVLLALRGAIVWREDDSYQYLRLGPFPFHITTKNREELNHVLRRCYRRQQIQETYLHSFASFIYLQTRLTSFLERWIHASINRTTRDSIILWDGSLMAGTPETPIKDMEQLLKQARDNRNVMLAFSKITKLILFDKRLPDLVSGNPPPCILKIGNLPLNISQMQPMGNMYVARLTEGSCAFRLDIDKKLPDVNAVAAVQRLIGNDLITQSYPETLRLAHIFSTFTATEVLAIQRCVAKESKVRILARPNVRRILFGRFGKGPEIT